MSRTAEERRAYGRGYSRGSARYWDHLRRLLRIARGYREKTDQLHLAHYCGGCFHWSRGGKNCLWGHCDTKFEAGLEPNLWADAPIGHTPQKICTHENFGCVNWISASQEKA